MAGRMTALVLPEPMAPTTQMPVYKPRSGIDSQRGVGDGFGFNWW